MRNSGTINLIADVIAPLAVIGVTVGLFFIFMPAEPGYLFYSNLVYSVLLEVILFAYIFWLPSRGDSVALKWVCGTFTIFYLCLSLLWMLLYGLLLSHWWHIKVYYAVIAVLTVLWILINSLSFKADNANEVSKAILTDNRRELNRIINRASVIRSQFDLLAISHPEIKVAANSVTSLCRGISTLSPTAMSDANALSSINAICNGLDELISEPFTETSAMRIKEFADKSMITLNSIKNLIRK